jgi:cell division protein FtsI (penicillin-binding protein 3)
MDNTKKTYKIATLFFLFILGFLIFLLASFKIVVEKIHPFSMKIAEKDRAVRGRIITSDGFVVTDSKKLYKVTVNKKYIDPQKMDLFVKLFSIYSNIEDKKIYKIIKDSHTPNVTLSYAIEPKQAKLLHTLARRLSSMEVFLPYRVKNRFIKPGLNIIESGESRIYPYKNILSPVLGYVQKKEVDGYTKIYGVKGLEKFYQMVLKPKQDGYLYGYRDIANNIILNKEAKIKRKINGYDLILNISLLLQKRVEEIIDKYKKDFRAKEIVACIMRSRNGKILALASTNRFNPKKIKKSEYLYLNPAATEYLYEPGSVLKPIVFSLLLEHKLVMPYEIVNGHNGIYRIGRRTIRDEHKFKWLSAENVIVYSSNIGMAQLSQRLNYIDYFQGLRNFGFSKKTQIDLPYEKNGMLPDLSKFKTQTYKASLGYGYGLMATFMQLLKAYNIFNNNGKMVNPHIAFCYRSKNKKIMVGSSSPPVQVISPATAARMQDILIKVVKKGTGKNAFIEGITIGGKTGTAQISEKGSYVSKYHSSFFGFANDENRRYTIGVLIIEPKKKYFASQTAAVVFRDIVDVLIDEKFLRIKE